MVQIITPWNEENLSICVDCLSLLDGDKSTTPSLAALTSKAPKKLDTF